MTARPLGGWATLVAMRVAGALVPWLPAPVLQTAAQVAGMAAYGLGRPARRAAARNLAAVLDPDDPDLVALRLRETFRTQAQNYVDLFRIPRLSLDEIEALVQLRGWQNVQAALAAGRGAILASAHLGNVDLVVQFASARGVQLTIPVEPLQPPELLDYVTGLRAAHGLRLVPIGRAALAAVFRALRAGEMVGFAIDRDVQGTGMPTPMFGRRARLSHAPALVALRSGAPILPARCRRLAGGRFMAEVGEPIWPPAERGPEAVADLMARLVAWMEEAIRQNPGQWVMFQPLFEPPEAQ